MTAVQTIDSSATAARQVVPFQSGVLKRWMQTRPGGFEGVALRAGLGPAPRLQFGQRNYAAARVDRLTDGWTTTSLSSTASMLGQLDTLRARSRALHRDNDYAKKFQKLVTTNVVGPNGFRLESRVSDDNGQADQGARTAIENAWDRFSARGVCDISRRHSLPELCRLLLKSASRDGEYLVRKIRGTAARNAFGLALQVLDVNRIDTLKNRSAADGVNAIIMGVEVDQYLAPVAYHLRASIQGDIYHATKIPQPAQRIPADELMHGYISDEPEQLRGVPWMHASMVRLNNLGGYEEAAVIASRVGASKMGFFKSPEGQAETLASAGDGTEASPFVTDAAPGQFDVLPQGYDFTPFNPEYPTAMFADFVKANLRGVASGLGVSYHSLANDLQGVNFSSIRSGTLEERDAWMVLQNWFIDSFLRPLFLEWLTNALAFGQIKLGNGSALPLSKLDKFSEHQFNGRRWMWVDPLKDIKASIMAMQAGVTAPQTVAAGMGEDLETVLALIEQANALAKARNVNISTLMDPMSGAQEPDTTADDAIN